MADTSASKKRKSDDSAFGAIGLPDKIGQSTIFYGSDFTGRDVRLIEVTEDLLESLRKKESLSIIGPIEASNTGGSSDAVLTSNEKTYSIKKVEQSNAVYIVDPSKTDIYRIQSASQDYYELKVIPPLIDKIKELCVLYEGTEAEITSPTDESTLLSYNKLRNQVQASNKEFSSALFKFGAVELRGKMRLLSKAAIRKTTQLLLFTIMEQGWNINHINEDLCTQFIPEVDSVLLQFSLKLLGQKVQKEQKEGNLGEESNRSNKEGVEGAEGAEGAVAAYWKLDQDTISKATAHILFNSNSDPTTLWNCEEFLSTWESDTPGTGVPSESLLAGIAIKIEVKKHKSLTNNGSGSAFSYRYLPFEELSLNLQTRLNQLFDAQPRYLERELEPYFKDMIGGIGKPKSIAELLLSHTRMIDDFYCAK